MSKLQTENWEKLTSAEKEETISAIIKERNLELTIQRTETFSQNGIEIETVLLTDKNGDEFVFVPGNSEVTLGWDEFSELGDETKKALQFDFDEVFDFEMENWEDIIADIKSEIEELTPNGTREKIKELKEELTEVEADKPVKKTVKAFKNHIVANTSPLRTASIPPMIVQCDMQSIEEDMTYDAFINKLENESFTVPTEDEWEYLCGGGARSLFRWGDLTENEFEAIYSVGTQNESDLLYKPNMFGLHIAYNTYQYEIVNSECLVKGGDGGCHICGGDGGFYVAPVFSSFYAASYNYDELNKNYCCYRKIVRL